MLLLGQQNAQYIPVPYFMVTLINSLGTVGYHLTLDTNYKVIDNLSLGRFTTATNGAYPKACAINGNGTRFAVAFNANINLGAGTSLMPHTFAVSGLSYTEDSAVDTNTGPTPNVVAWDPANNDEFVVQNSSGGTNTPETYRYIMNGTPQAIKQTDASTQPTTRNTTSKNRPYSPDGNYLCSGHNWVSGGSQNGLYVYDATDFTAAPDSPGPTSSSGPNNAFDYSNDSTYVLWGANQTNQNWGVWNMTTGAAYTAPIDSPNQLGSAERHVGATWNSGASINVTTWNTYDNTRSAVNKYLTKWYDTSSTPWAAITPSPTLPFSCGSGSSTNTNGGVIWASNPIFIGTTSKVILAGSYVSSGQASAAGYGADSVLFQTVDTSNWAVSDQHGGAEYIDSGDMSGNVYFYVSSLSFWPTWNKW